MRKLILCMAAHAALFASASEFVDLSKGTFSDAECTVPTLMEGEGWYMSFKLDLGCIPLSSSDATKHKDRHSLEYEPKASKMIAKETDGKMMMSNQYHKELDCSGEKFETTPDGEKLGDCVKKEGTY